MAETDLSIAKVASEVSENSYTDNSSTCTCDIQLKQELREVLEEIKSLRKTQLDVQKSDVLSDTLTRDDCKVP